MIATQNLVRYKSKTFILEILKSGKSDNVA